MPETIYKFDENLHTLRGEIPNLGMDTKTGGGIHLWIKGNVTQMPENGVSIISVHLTRKQAVFLAKEILYRIVHEFETRVNEVLNLDI